MRRLAGSGCFLYMISVFPMRATCSDSVFSVISLVSVVFCFLWALNFILISSWSLRVFLIWVTCSGVTPCLPICIWGVRWCACARRLIFCLPFSVIWCFFVGRLLLVGVRWWGFGAFFGFDCSGFLYRSGSFLGCSGGSYG